MTLKDFTNKVMGVVGVFYKLRFCNEDVFLEISSLNANKIDKKYLDCNINRIIITPDNEWTCTIYVELIKTDLIKKVEDK